MCVVYGTTAKVAGAAIRNFRIGPSLSNRDVRFEFESNLEASQVPSIIIPFVRYVVLKIAKKNDLEGRSKLVTVRL